MALILRNNLRPLDKDNGQTGIYAPTVGSGWNTVSAALTASRAYFARFVPSRDMLIASMYFYVITAGADVACDVGIYSSDLQTKLGASTAATGRLAASSTGRNVALVTPVQLTAGTTYYAAFSSDAGSTASLTFAVFAGAGTAAMFGATAGKVELDYKAASHPLPATLSVTGNLGGVPLLALRES